MATLGERNNNPGCIRAGSGYAKYATLEEGYMALASLLQRKYSNRTALSIFEVYAPSSDGNNPNDYAARVINMLRRKGLNVNSQTRLDMSNPVVLREMMAAISKVECGKILGGEAFVDYGVSLHLDHLRQGYYWVGKDFADLYAGKIQNATARDILSSVYTVADGCQALSKQVISALNKRGLKVNENTLLNMQDPMVLAAFMEVMAKAKYGNQFQSGSDDLAYQAAKNFIHAREATALLKVNSKQPQLDFSRRTTNMPAKTGGFFSQNSPNFERVEQAPQPVKPTEMSLVKMYYDRMRALGCLNSKTPKRLSQSKAGIIVEKNIPVLKNKVEQAFLTSMAQTEKTILKNAKASPNYQVHKAFATASLALEQQLKSPDKSVREKSLKMLTAITQQAMREIYERHNGRALTEKEAAMIYKNARKMVENSQILKNPTRFFNYCKKVNLMSEKEFVVRGSSLKNTLSANTERLNEEDSLLKTLLNNSRLDSLVDISTVLGSNGRIA